MKKFEHPKAKTRTCTTKARKDSSSKSISGTSTRFTTSSEFRSILQSMLTVSSTGIIRALRRSKIESLKTSLPCSKSAASAQKSNGGSPRTTVKHSSAGVDILLLKTESLELFTSLHKTLLSRLGQLKSKFNVETVSKLPAEQLSRHYMQRLSQCRAAGNNEIQSPGGEITKALQVNLWKLQPVGAHPWVVQPLNVHDEIMCPTKAGYEEQVEAKAKETVEEYRKHVPLLDIDWFTNIPDWSNKKGESRTDKAGSLQLSV
jgi:hypothetical protein